MHDSVLLSQVLDKATRIAKSIGGIDYMEDRSKEIGALLAERASLPERITIREPNRGMVAYTVKRWEVKPSRRRYVSATKLKAQFPHAYRAVVTSTNPDRVYQLRLDGPRVGKKSEEWAALKAVGASNSQEFFEGKFDGATWGPDTYLKALHMLRTNTAASKARLEASKDELTEFIVDHELPLIVPGLRDGRVTLRENGPKLKIDYDMLEQRFPNAAKLLVTTTTQPGGTRVMLKEFVPDDDNETGDEDEW